MDFTSFQGIEKLGMIGLLVVAVVFLWKKLNAKDDLLTLSVQQGAEHTAVLEQVVDGLERLREDLLNKRAEDVESQIESLRALVQAHLPPK